MTLVRAQNGILRPNSALTCKQLNLSPAQHVCVQFDSLLVSGFCAWQLIGLR